VRDAALVHCRDDFQPIHGRVGDEYVFVCQVVDDAAMMCFAGRIVRKGCRVGSNKVRTTKRSNTRSLNRESQACRMRKRATDGLRG
jgi:hypothetical protein